MKILYIGTVCDLNEYEEFLMGCENVPSRASIVFENALLKGFKENNAEVCIYSYPMIPTYPKCKHILWGNSKQKLESGYSCTWLKTVNLPIIKQLSRRINGRKLIKQWLKANIGEDCVVISYSIPPFLAKDIVRYCGKFNVNCYAIVPDLLEDMYKNHKANSVVNRLRYYYLKPALTVQGMFKGYIYFTEAMSTVINPEKPFIVVEAIADVKEETTGICDEKITEKFAIMYAGGLHEEYGIINLIDAFQKIDTNNIELWLFGNGSAVETIKKRAEFDSRIKYFGNMDRDKVLDYERKASLLVNPRNVNDEFTRYSFPSKTIEYMLSETPVLTTRLSGIPEEYFDYLIVADSNDVDILQEKIMDVLKMSEEQRIQIGVKAKEFVINKKNAKVQAQNILQFISDNLK